MELSKADSTLRILLVEDNEHDRHAFRRTFKKSSISCNIEECDTAEKAITRLRTESSSFDVVVSDHGLPGMKGLDFFKELLAIKTSLPLVLITGSGSEQIAIEALKAGVYDYIIKDVHGGYLELLPVTIHKVVEKYREKARRIKVEEEREKLVHELQRALANIKSLTGLLPICASCKKIRDDKGYWHQVETYIKKHTEVDFTHSICPECIKKRYSGLFDKNKE